MVLNPGGELAPAPDPFDPLELLPVASAADRRWAPAAGYGVPTWKGCLHGLPALHGTCGYGPA